MELECQQGVVCVGIDVEILWGRGGDKECFEEFFALSFVVHDKFFFASSFLPDRWHSSASSFFELLTNVLPCHPYVLSLYSFDPLLPVPSFRALNFFLVPVPKIPVPEVRQVKEVSSMMLQCLARRVQFFLHF